MKHLYSFLLAAVLGVAAVPACKPADAATVLRSSPQTFIPMVDYIAAATGDQSDLTMTGLDGDAHGNLRCYGEIVHKGASGNVTYSVRPLSAANDTSLTSLIEYNNGSAAYVGSNSGSPNALWHLQFENSNPSDASIVFKFDVIARTGRKRQFWSTATSIRASAGVITEKTQGWSTDTATNITQMTIHSNVSSAIRSGSYMVCRADGNAL